MSVVAVIQARMGSSRLPGKVMLPLAGIPVVEHGVRAQRAAESVDEVVVATTTRPADDVVARHARRAGACTHRGAEEDVLGRVLDAARANDAGVVVRQTGDHPLLPPSIIDAAVDRLRSTDAGLVSNRLRRSFPRGTAVEAFTMPALERLDRVGTEPADREQPTRLYEAYADTLGIHHLTADEVFDDTVLSALGDLTRFRVVLDEPDDYERLWRLAEDISMTERAPLLDALRRLDDDPDRFAVGGRG